MKEIVNNRGSESRACLPWLLLQGILLKDERKEDFHLVSAFYVPYIGTRMSQILWLMFIVSQERDLCNLIFFMRNMKFADLDEPAWSGHQASAPSFLSLSPCG